MNNEQEVQRLFRAGGTVKMTALLLCIMWLCKIEFRSINLVVGGVPYYRDDILFQILIVVTVFLFLLGAFIKYLSSRENLSSKLKEYEKKAYISIIGKNNFYQVPDADELKEAERAFEEKAKNGCSFWSLPNYTWFRDKENKFVAYYKSENPTELDIKKINCQNFIGYYWVKAKFYFKFIIYTPLFLDYYLPKYMFILGAVSALGYVVRMV